MRHDASGNKLKIIVKSGGVITLRQTYVSGIEYRRRGATGPDSIESIYHPEGRVFYTTPTASRYEYSIRDHLGNTRITFSDLNNNNKVDVTNTATNEVLQENHYYPFGLGTNGAWMNNATSLDNLYQYNGKELNNDWGLNMLDYGARMYMADLGRWNGVDALGEKRNWASTYQYVQNNPFARIDPDGNLDKIVVKGSTEFKDQTLRDLQLLTNDKLRMKENGTVVIESRGTANVKDKLKEGTGLVRAVIGDERYTATIEETSGGNYTHVSRDAAIDPETGEKGIGSGSRIEYNPYSWEAFPDVNGCTERPPFIGLAHELGHSKNAFLGTVDTTPAMYDPEYPTDLIDGDEVNVRKLDNKIRDEQFIPRRVMWPGNSDE